mgnify:CR=1 FL=1
MYQESVYTSCVPKRGLALALPYAWGEGRGGNLFISCVVLYLSLWFNDQVDALIAYALIIFLKSSLPKDNMVELLSQLQQHSVSVLYTCVTLFLSDIQVTYQEENHLLQEKIF